jgi:3-oxoacyl-[acyl-carrier-protein] synthase-3
MNYSRVHISSLGYELPPVVVTSGELEDRLAPTYETLRIPPGQLEALTGIRERRWWEAGSGISAGAVSAARKALEKADLGVDEIGALIYAGVCRENFEPATACVVADAIGVRSDAYVYDVTNACLGVLNGIIDIANRIELKQIKAGMVVSCESAREINDVIIQQMLAHPTMEVFTSSLATLTGGSGAAAVILCDASMTKHQERRLLGAATLAAPEHHRLCRWGTTFWPVEQAKTLLSPEKLMTVINQVMDPATIPTALKDIMTSERLPKALARMMPSERLPAALTQFMATDSVAVLKHGAELGVRTWGAFLHRMGWACDQVDKVICHQVGTGHRNTILKELGISADKDYSTYPYLGNIGTVSLPLTAALAEQRGFLKSGDRVGFLGIGSGLNCMMLGWDW